MRKALAWVTRHRRATVAGAAMVAIGATALIGGRLNNVNGQVCGTAPTACIVITPVVPTVTVTTTTNTTTTTTTSAQPTVAATVTAATTPPPPPAPPTRTTTNPPPPPPAPTRGAASPTAAVNLGAGAQRPTTAQKPIAAAPVAQAPRVVVALPNTGAGSTSSSADDLALPLALVALGLGGAGALALRRPSR